ncbi:acetyl-CoA carboxylase subunit beta [Actinoplanes sp. SE50]|uniref:carboxyl transferase domain-containing protein n=1 Tax=unclassified Actinoplanes TaxID=2626549 RepID=UPI00023EE051|nr:MULTISPECIES: carboxyl transferase domain-containing protein [unclassified Actinoplanes]AEV88983.1 propionyl-CoA carboxylase beta chain [Actinoplanes sp. SE50/110]ATO87389.1 acetyl-CoA carboxylase subunit beta [Actinoplanes sp. SE50]SLM04807.1 acetyl-CoA carboxylase carboxyltransferase subunit [Actinoplanes sp. SE50/110]
MTVLDTTLDPRDPAYLEGRGTTLQWLAALEVALDEARAGGGEKWVTRHHARGKLLPRERIEMLLDQDSPFLELSPVAAWGSEFPVGASVVTGIGAVEGVECVVVANDPTVDGGAVNPYTAEKIRRAARIASENRLPLVNLVESAGDAAPAGSIARELSRLTADRVPTVCVVFGTTSGDAAYLPALSDYTIVVRGHAKVLTIHPQRSGVEVRATPVVPSGPAGPADQLAEDERDGLRLARQCVRRFNWRKQGPAPRNRQPREPRYSSEALLSLAAAGSNFEPREVLARILDDSDFDEFKPGQGSVLVAGWGELHGYPVGVLASPGIWLSPTESQKAVHFLQLANATATPVIFLRHPGETKGSDDADVRNDAPLVHAIAKSTVPHLVLTVGPEPGGTPARADQPRFQFSWPRPPADRAAADDGVIDPRDTRTVLGLCLSAVHSAAVAGAEHVGVFRP